MRQHYQVSLTILLYLRWYPTGVLMRKALGTTVKAEVADQLNRLINGQYRYVQCWFELVAGIVLGFVYCLEDHCTRQNTSVAAAPLHFPI